MDSVEKAFVQSHTDFWAEGKLEWEGLLQESTKKLNFYFFLFKIEIMACLGGPYTIEQYHHFQAKRVRSDAAGPLKLKPVLMVWCQRGDC